MKLKNHKQEIYGHVTWHTRGNCLCFPTNQCLVYATNFAC